MEHSSQMNLSSWAGGQLRTGGYAPHADVLFGFMHEDARAESSLLPEGGSALCVLSGGDMAYSFAAAGAVSVTAVDVNPAQLTLHRLKLACARVSDDSSHWSPQTIGDAISVPGVRTALGENECDYWTSRQRQHRPLLAGGAVDLRLRFIMRWVAPFFLPKPNELPTGFQKLKWNLAWSSLSQGLRLAFAISFRRHLPGDMVRRLKQRFESAWTATGSAQNPHLQRFLHPFPSGNASLFASSWPQAGADLIRTQVCTVQEAALPHPVHLVCLTNILDTAPADDLTPVLLSLESKITHGGCVVLRSLFRETSEWPPPPAGWQMDTEALARLQSLDRAPLCRVSLVLRRMD